ncbi:hypothetical protein JW949_02245 [Candidatus Woesearchaeota archaeon]|nr:hypothetical protein [Candidatus Woesearchaeota archaeon]
MVEIHIDTKKDSREEIKKIIEYLKSIVGDSSSYGDSSGSNEDYNAEEGIFNIFGDSSSEDKDDEDNRDEEESEEYDEPVRLVRY